MFPIRLQPTLLGLTAIFTFMSLFNHAWLAAIFIYAQSAYFFGASRLSRYEQSSEGWDVFFGIMRWTTEYQACCCSSLEKNVVVAHVISTVYHIYMSSTTFLLDYKNVNHICLIDYTCVCMLQDNHSNRYSVARVTSMTSCRVFNQHAFSWLCDCICFFVEEM
jgi:hypothetical protein